MDVTEDISVKIRAAATRTQFVLTLLSLPKGAEAQSSL